MKRVKKLLAVILATTMAMACYVSSFAVVNAADTANPVIVIEEKTETGLLHVKAGDVITIANITSSSIRVISTEEGYLWTAEPGGGMIFVSADEWFMEYSYKKGSHKVYLTDVTAQVAAVQASPVAQQYMQESQAKQQNVTPAANSAPANSSQAAATPNLNDPQIKALWDQAAAIKQAYDAETNLKKKKELQKQFTDIMNQIPM